MAPLAPIRIGKGKGAAAPLLLPSLHLLLPPSPSWNRKGGGANLLGVGLPPLGRASPLGRPSPPSPLLLLQLGKKGVLFPVGVGLPLGAPSLAVPPSPLAPLYTGAGGHPMDTTIDLLIS